MKTTVSVLATVAMLALAGPAFAGKGGQPNENARERSRASENAHGRNPTAAEKSGGHRNSKSLNDPQPTKGADTKPRPDVFPVE